MISNVNSSLAGLNAYAQKMAVSASNVANARTPEFKPQAADLEATPAGGVSVNIRTADQPSVSLYSPNEAAADESGMIEMPNVNMVQELLEQKMSVIGYKANAEVIKAGGNLDRALLDITA